VGSRAEKDLTFRHLAARLTRYITNDRSLSAHQVVAEARDRCNQENLHAQLKGAMRALHAPVNTLVANWALCPGRHSAHYVRTRIIGATTADPVLDIDFECMPVA
jgi:hypothetical protein